MRKVAVLLTLCAAMGCAPVDPSEDTSEEVETSESEALSLSLVNLVPWITATDTTVTFDYSHGSELGPLTLTLTGPLGTYSLPESAWVVNLQGSTLYRTTFTGLAECAPFTWAVVSGGATYASGAIHTRNYGNAACPDTQEAITATSAIQLHAVGHMYDGTDGLAYGQYPWGSGWTFKSVPGTGTFTAGSFHYAGPNEWFVEAYRARLSWTLDAIQMRRATDAKVFAPYTMGDITHGDPVCAAKYITERELVESVWPLTTTQTMNLSPWGNRNWATALNGPEVGHGLQPLGDGYRYPATNLANQTMTVDFGKPSANVINAGFMGFDGFPSQVNQQKATYPQDNDKCRVDFAAPKLVLTYDALPPSTPLGCSVAIDCKDAHISCNAGGDVFAIHQVTSAGDVVAATVDMTASPTTALSQTVTSSSGPASYYVCTVTGAGQACTPVLVPTSNNACLFVNLNLATTTLMGGETESLNLSTLSQKVSGPVTFSFSGFPPGITPHLSTSSSKVGDSLYLYLWADKATTTNTTSVATITATAGGVSGSTKLTVTGQVYQCFPTTSCSGLCGKVDDGCGGTLTCPACPKCKPPTVWNDTDGACEKPKNCKLHPDDCL